MNKYKTFSGQGHVSRLGTEEVTALKDQVAKQAAAYLASQEAMMRQFAAMQSNLMEQLMATQKQMVEVQKEVFANLHSKLSNRQEVCCFNYYKKGHYARDCSTPKKKSGNDEVQVSK